VHHFRIDSDDYGHDALCGKSSSWDGVELSTHDVDDLNCPECLLRLAQLGINAKARLAKLRATITAELNPPTGWFR